jgi:hypothetical protein
MVPLNWILSCQKTTQHWFKTSNTPLYLALIWVQFSPLFFGVGFPLFAYLLMLLELKSLQPYYYHEVHFSVLFRLSSLASIKKFLSTSS